MSEENKALTRRSWEIVAKGSLETLDDALQEVYADDIVMHEPDEDVRGIEGLTQFVSMIRSALPDLRITLDDDLAEGEKVVSRWRAQGTHQGELWASLPRAMRWPSLGSLSIASKTARSSRSGRTGMPWV